MTTLQQTPLLKVNLADGTPHTMYAAWPRQVDFHQSPITNLIAIGSRGSGKSLALRMDAHMRALSVPDSKLILIRKTYKDLLKSHILDLKKEMQLLGGYYHATDYIAYYPNGSKLFLSYVGHDADSMNLLSAEFLAAYFDELSVIPWEYFLKLCASVRVTDKNLRAVVRAATNPLGESAGEVNRYFVTKEVDPEEDPEYDPSEWGHIRIDMEDNPSLDIEQYKKRFAGLSEHVKRAWLLGEYSEENTLFDFYPSKIINDVKRPWHVIRDIDIAELVKSARIYRVFDYGWAPDPAYCAWIAHLGNRYIAFHEHTWNRTIVADIAYDIKQIDEALGVQRVVTTYCDPTLDIHTGHDIRTMKDIFEAHGIPMDCSINNREQFAQAVHQALSDEVTIGEGHVVPKLQIYHGGPGRGCPYMIKAIPLQRFNPKKILAMDDQQHDHPVVSIAYFLLSHSADDQRAFKQRETKPWMKPQRAERHILGSESVKQR